MLFGPSNLRSKRLYHISVLTISLLRHVSKGNVDKHHKNSEIDSFETWYIKKTTQIGLRSHCRCYVCPYIYAFGILTVFVLSHAISTQHPKLSTQHPPYFFKLSTQHQPAITRIKNWAILPTQGLQFSHTLIRAFPKIYAYPKTVQFYWILAWTNSSHRARRHVWCWVEFHPHHYWGMNWPYPYAVWLAAYDKCHTQHAIHAIATRYKVCFIQYGWYTPITVRVSFHAYCNGDYFSENILTLKNPASNTPWPCDPDKNPTGLSVYWSIGIKNNKQSLSREPRLMVSAEFLLYSLGYLPIYPPQIATVMKPISFCSMHIPVSHTKSLGESREWNMVFQCNIWYRLKAF